MNAPVGVLEVKSFAGRAHARWIVVAGNNPREKGIHDAAFGHYGLTVAKVSFEHEYSHDPELSAENAADYAERLVACADAMKGIADPRAFVAAFAELTERERVMRAALVDLKDQCERNLELGAAGTGYWEDAQDTIDAALNVATVR